MRVYALISSQVADETLDLFLTQEAAETELREILEDEPEWVNVLMTDLSHHEFREMWDSMTEEQRDLVRAKAQWEHMGLWAVLNEWPSLRSTGIGSKSKCRHPTMKARAARTLA